MNDAQKRNSMDIQIWRDSVAAGDDALAPHAQTIQIESGEQIGRTLEKILASRYLPSIQGGKATWILIGRKQVAVIAQQWDRPHYFVESAAQTQDLLQDNSDHQLGFLYWCQVEPEDVIASINQGTAWPDKYGRDRKT